MHETLGANLRRLHEVGQLVKLFSGVVGTTRSTDTADVGCIVEYSEISTSLQCVLKFDEFHTEAHIGLVRTEATHSLMPRHADEGLVAQIVAAYLLEEIFGHFLEGADDIVLSDERHFAVNLCEFGLTVSAEVLIAEALCNLEIAVRTSHHQQLLQSLRALRKGIELSGIHA